MLHFENFSAWVTVDDVELQQYSVEQSGDQKRVTCWIASEAGKKFMVNWKDSVQSYSSSGMVSVDGTCCGQKVLYNASHPNGSGTKSIAQAGLVRTSATTARPLIFSQLELTDDDKYLNVPISAELGYIKLEIHEVMLVGETSYTGKRTLPEPDKIHERSKKAVGHRVRLGDEVSGFNSNIQLVTEIRLVRTFVFKYRPLGLLHANGIAPLDKECKRVAVSEEPTGDDSAGEDGDASDTSQRIQALKAELETLEASRRKQGKGSKKIKVEVNTNVKVKPELLGPSHGQIIDLT